MTQEILSITQVNTYIQKILDQDLLLTNIAVRGEISNYKVYPSGHHYFTLKDDASAIKCVMFRGNAMRLRFQPENGMKIIAMGRISVYPRDGAYQLYCTAMAADGVGDLHAAFEQLKTKLAAKGLFDQEHKKRIPQYPQRIGVITSSAGAAIHDILRVLRARYPLTKVLLLPVRVQGAEAPDEIAAAIRYANHQNLADVLIIGRGGGSIEDLWAFNDEKVAYAIYESQIPTISAVGHEVDVTISDFVADVRAATPSNAAELAVPDQNDLRHRIDAFLDSLCTGHIRRLDGARKHLNLLASSYVLTDPYRQVKQRREQIALYKDRLVSAQNHLIHNRKVRFVGSAAKLDALSPLKVLSRGYAITQTKDNTVIRSVNQIKINDAINISVSDGTVSATVTSIKENYHE